MLFLFWDCCDVTPQIHIPYDVTSPLFGHTDITDHILKQNIENKSCVKPEPWNEDFEPE